MDGESHKMGYLGATSYVVGNIIGSGIFITPASILRCSFRSPRAERRSYRNGPLWNGERGFYENRENDEKLTFYLLRLFIIEKIKQKSNLRISHKFNTVCET